MRSISRTITPSRRNRAGPPGAAHPAQELPAIDALGHPFHRPCPTKAQDMLHHEVKSVSLLASPPTARGRTSASGLYIRRRGSVDDRKRDLVTTVSELRVD